MDPLVLRASQEAIFTSLKRMNSIAEPAIRYGMFLEILRMTIDFGVSAGKVSTTQCLIEAREKLEDLQATEAATPVGKNPREHVRTIASLKGKIQEYEQGLAILDKNIIEYRKYFDAFYEWIRQSPSRGTVPCSSI